MSKSTKVKAEGMKESFYDDLTVSETESVSASYVASQRADDSASERSESPKPKHKHKPKPKPKKNSLDDGEKIVEMNTWVKSRKKFRIKEFLEQMEAIKSVPESLESV